MNKTVIVHNNNIANIEQYDDKIRFLSIENTLESLLEKKQEFDTIYIKDNLSINCLDFLGLVLAYHIRFTDELKYKTIVMLSDLDGFTLSKITPFSQILLTKNTFFNKEPEVIPLFNQDNYDTDFLNKITVERPRDTSSNHDIANKWSIYRWAELIKPKGKAIDANKIEVNEMLYFKYLKALYSDSDNNTGNIKSLTCTGNILFIDDEWEKGWHDILKSALSREGVVFDSLEYNYKDKDYLAVSANIDKKLNAYNSDEIPDVIILDLRLMQNDHETDNIDNYSGIKILQKIHEINAGIQVIMLTATSKSTTLEKLYEKKILGYIKKEHPDDKSINTIENINKLMTLVDNGLDKKYLKQVFNVQNEILSLDIFEELVFSFNMQEKDKKLFELKNNISFVFEILNSNMPKPFLYAMFTIFKCLELVIDCYIREENIGKGKYQAIWVDSDRKIKSYNSTENKILEILDVKFKYKTVEMDKEIHQIVCSRNYAIHSGEEKERCIEYLVKSPNEINIQDWFTMLAIILEKMDKTK